MPIFEYECLECRHRFEYLVLRSSPAAECPSCGKKDLKQMISLCTVSSETSRQASLSAAHRRAAAIRRGNQHESHTHEHEHYEDHKI